MLQAALAAKGAAASSTAGKKRLRDLLATSRGDSVELELNMSDGIPLRDWIEVEVLDAATGEPLTGLQMSCKWTPNPRVLAVLPLSLRYQ